MSPPRRPPALLDVQRLLDAAEPAPEPGSPRYEAKKEELLGLMAAGFLAALDARLTGDAARAREIEAAVFEAARPMLEAGRRFPGKKKKWKRTP